MKDYLNTIEIKEGQTCLTEEQVKGVKYRVHIKGSVEQNRGLTNRNLL